MNDLTLICEWGEQIMEIFTLNQNPAALSCFGCLPFVRDGWAVLQQLQDVAAMPLLLLMCTQPQIEDKILIKTYWCQKYIGPMPEFLYSLNM